MRFLRFKKEGFNLLKKFSLSLVLLLALSFPAFAEFAALERSTTSGGIIYSVTEREYRDKDGNALTEAAIANFSVSEYRKTGLTADGNTRLILRYRAQSSGTVSFSVSPSIPGSKLERLADRSEITAPLSTVSVGSANQVSAVFVAPETWPSALTYPSGKFTITATFTPASGSPVTESVSLTLEAPSVVLIHGAFGDNERMFGYSTGTKSGVWHKLANAGLNVVSWNYDNLKGPKTVIANSENGLAKVLAETFDKLNSKGIASTRVDLVTHSSGGLMARQFLRNDIDTGNKSSNSYGLGSVRRVVTIASPNLGSPVASYLAGKFSEMPASWKNWEARSWWEDIAYGLLNFFVFIKEGKDPSDVLEDMSLGSSLIPQLGYPAIPFHAIYGKIKVDNEKFNELFEAVKRMDTLYLSQITWLPKHFVDLLVSDKLALISTVLNTVDKAAHFKELLGAFFGDNDHDLIVSEPSAKDIFPSNALTSYEGLGYYNHIIIAQQDVVGDRVLSLLKGGTESFMINTASTSAYDRAFDSFVSDYESTLKSSESSSQYVDDSLSLEASDPQPEYFGSDEERPVIQSVQLSGSSEKVFNDEVIVMFTNGNGEAKFFTLPISGDSSFDVSVWANKEDQGVLEVSYITVQAGELKISPAKKIVIPPLIDGIVTGLSGSSIYCHAGESVPIGLVALTDEGNYDISAASLGVTQYSVSDKNIVTITDSGYVTALNVGTATITATAYGFTYEIKVDVMASASDERRSSSGSSSGCSAGFSAVMLLSLLPFVRKSR